MFLSIILIILGFILLIKGADFLVNGASIIAKRFHIPELIIGLTIVSIGTSMPELFLSITSAIKGYSDLTIGNVIGSNISNIFIILGISAIIKPIHFKRETRLIELPMCFAISIIFMVLCNIGQDVTRIDALILLALFVMFILYTIIMAKKGEEFDKEEGLTEEVEKENNSNLLKNIIWIILGSVLLKFGGDLTIDNALNVAKAFNLSDKIISITILSIGTSLPELVTSISGATKGKSDIAIGNILGSNIFNMLLIIGTSALIKPISYNISYNIEMFIFILATFALAVLSVIPPKNKMSRENGFIFFVVYVAYMFSLFIKS